MAVVTVSPFILKDVILEIAVNEYQAACSSVEFTNTTNIVRFTGLGNNTHTVASTPEWSCVITFAQDWETAGSLSQYLLANAGAKVPAEFKPQSGSGPSFTANLTLVAPNIGGTGGAIAVSSVTLGSDEPVLVPGL